MIVMAKIAYESKLKGQAKMAFKNTFKKTGLPIVTLRDRLGNPINLLVDTGSNVSHLKLGVIEAIADSERVVPVDKNGNSVSKQAVITASGEVSPTGYYRLTLFHGDKMFTEVFEVLDLNTTFEGWGVEIHGILGGTFLDKYKYVLDYSDKTMFIR